MATIKGRKVDWLHNVGDLSVRALLNDEDEDAKTQNAGREAPVLLEGATASNGAPFSHVIVVDPGSVIKLEIRSNGPLGFGYRVSTPVESIAERLYCLKDDETNAAPVTDMLRRYQRTNTLIRVDDWRSLGLDTREDRAARWSLDIVSWKVHGYLDDMKAIFFGTPRPVAKALLRASAVDAAADRGASVTGGAIGAWRARFSSQEIGSVSSVNEDERNNGYLNIHLFTINDPKERSELFL